MDREKVKVDITFPAIVRIDSLVSGGDSLGRLDGLAVFVPRGVPGDLARVDEVKRSNDYIAGRILEILEPSPLRRDPKCPYFTACGGCQWQHITYPGQLEAKEKLLTDALTRIGGFREINSEPIVPSPDEFGYRHRVQLKVLTSSGHMRWGFFAATSHSLVDIRKCLIAHPSINAIIADLGNFFPAMRINPSSLGCVELNADETGRRVQCILHPRRRRFPIPAHGRHIRFGAPGNDGIDVSIFNATMIKKLPVQPREFMFTSGKGMTLTAGAGVFSQTNLSLNPLLVDKVLEYAQPSPSDAIADIYCGVGNYSIPLARYSARVEAIENNRRACSYGQQNAVAAGLENVHFIPKNAREALATLPRGITTAVINPPRVGASDIMTGIAELAPQRVVYVSCNPATLARDLATLSLSGYHLAKLAPFDMFPQTHHLETVALMVKDA